LNKTFSALLTLYIFLFSSFTFANDGNTHGDDYSTTGGSTGTPVYDYSSGEAVIQGELGGSSDEEPVRSESVLRALRARNPKKNSGSQNRIEAAHNLKKTFSDYELKNYSKRADVKALINKCVENGKKLKIKGLCWRHVKRALNQTNFTKQAYGRWASRAGNSLKKEGFINLLDNPKYKKMITSPLDPDIPAGAVLVYSGTNSCKYVKQANGIKDCKKPERKNLTTVPLGKGWGHVEIFVGKQKYASDKEKKRGIKDADVPERNSYCYDGLTNISGSGAGFEETRGMVAGTGRRKRKLIGVWVKPGVK
jgi:hypothetical protein